MCTDKGSHVLDSEDNKMFIYYLFIGFFWVFLITISWKTQNQIFWAPELISSTVQYVILTCENLIEVIGFKKFCEEWLCLEAQSETGPLMSACCK